MQAVILVGGEGKRLRPLTSTVPKPVVPLVDRPFIAFMLEWLKGHGIDDVIMSCGFLATSVRNVLGDGSSIGVALRYVEEPDPRGTAGALKFAERLLDERFLMLNGDVLTDIDLTGQIAQHERTGAKATLALAPVRDPSTYGLVHLHEDRSVKDFVEKPSPDRDRHQPDQRGRVRAATRDPRAGPAGSQRLDRARGLAAADRQGAVRIPRRRLLAGHRHARALPAGHLRHHRGQRRDRGARAARRELAGDRRDRRAARPRRSRRP